VDGVLEPAVLAEPFAVIGRDRHDGRPLAVVHRRVEQRGERVVGVEHLAVVAADQLLELRGRDARQLAAVERNDDRRRALAEDGGRYVRRVRIEVVHEEEERLRRGREPAPRRVGRRGRAAVEAAEALGAPEGAGIGLGLAERRARLGELGVVVIEAARPAEARIEHEARDEAGGRIAVAAEDLGERRHARRERLAVAQQAVALRLVAGEERRVARRGGGRRRVRALEHDALAREPVEGRRRERTAVGAERVGAERVDGDEHDVGWGGGVAT
jgi:hypothetical protein